MTVPRPGRRHHTRLGPLLAAVPATLAATAAELRAQQARALLAASPIVAPALPASALSLRDGGAWRTWWRSDAAPARWDAGHPALARAARWRNGADGVEWAELALGSSGEAWRTRVVVVRLDPSRVALRLDTAFAMRPIGRVPAWTIARAGDASDDGIRFALSAGQFLATLPWGWVVLDGREWKRPGSGPLASAFVVDSAGRARLVHGDSLARTTVNERHGAAAWAFQSYPTLLAGGAVPDALRAPDRGVDLTHRDARAAIGTTADGRVLVALTRFDALGGRLGFVPFGLTVPEMAALMGALGARDAVLLDGGISAQMLLRDARGRVRAWPGLRPVPLALVAAARR